MVPKVRWWRPVLLMSAMAGLMEVQAAAETCTLELKRLSGSSRRVAYDPSDYMLRAVSSQSFWMQPGVEQTDQKAAFAKAVKKEPEKYECKAPFRAVMKLGSENVAFVLDSTNLAKGYDRLYFDRNRNGDLTDDEVIKANATSSGFFGGNSSQRDFPRLDVMVKAGDASFEASFFLTVYSQINDERNGYASASIEAAAYRQGEITLDGKKRKIFLLDYNSNGRFDDVHTVDPKNHSDDGRVWPQQGDVLLIDPDIKNTYNWYDPTANDMRYLASKTIGIYGKFYDLSVTPAGDKLTLTPSTAAVGYVTNPNENFGVMVYGDLGVLLIRGTKGKPIPLPEGQWRLLSYTIDLTATSKPADKEQEKPKKAGLLSRLAGSLMGTDDSSGGADRSPRYTMVSASGTDSYKAVTVRKGQTVELPFGPPYSPAVKVEPYRRSEGSAELSMVLVGSTGEVCSNLVVKGDRPASPTFAITAPDGEIVERGKFEYG
jgi:hypothetical protein